MCCFLYCRVKARSSRSSLPNVVELESSVYFASNVCSSSKHHPRLVPPSNSFSFSKSKPLRLFHQSQQVSLYPHHRGNSVLSPPICADLPTIPRTEGRQLQLFPQQNQQWPSACWKNGEKDKGNARSMIVGRLSTPYLVYYRSPGSIFLFSLLLDCKIVSFRFTRSSLAMVI